MGRKFFHTFQTDWIKYRKSLLSWASLGYPLLAVFLVFIFTLGDKRNPDQAAFQFARNSMSVAAFFLPFYLVLCISVIGFIEHRSQGWKLMYAQPVKKGYFYISKLFILFLYMGGAFLMKFIFSLLAIFFLQLSKPQFKVIEFLLIWPGFIVPELKIILSSFLLIAVQYWLSLRMRNFILPFGIGIFAAILPLAVFIILGIAGILTSPDKLKLILQYDPYSLPFSFVFDEAWMKNSMRIVQVSGNFVLISSLAGILTGIAGFLDVRRRNIR